MEANNLVEFEFQLGDTDEDNDPDPQSILIPYMKSIEDETAEKLRGASLLKDTLEALMASIKVRMEYNNEIQISDEKHDDNPDSIPALIPPPYEIPSVPSSTVSTLMNTSSTESVSSELISVPSRATDSQTTLEADNKAKGDDDEEVLRMIKDLDESTRSLLEAIQNSVQYDMTETNSTQESHPESSTEGTSNSESIIQTNTNDEYARQFYENIYLFQARNAFQEGKHSKCIETCRFVRSLNPNNTTAKDLAIRSYLEIGCVAEAYAELSSGVDSIEELYLLGNVYMKMGKLTLYATSIL